LNTSNKEVWARWVEYYNSKELKGCHYDGFAHIDIIENMFFNVVPYNYRELMVSLISCLHWHEYNKQNLINRFLNCDWKDTIDLCGYCYDHKRKYRSCRTCPLFDKTGVHCDTWLDSISYQALHELRDENKYGKSCKKFYKLLLNLYKIEYEKLFGKDWRSQLPLD